MDNIYADGEKSDDKPGYQYDASTYDSLYNFKTDGISIEDVSKYQIPLSYSGMDDVSNYGIESNYGIVNTYPGPIDPTFKMYDFNYESGYPVDSSDSTNTGVHTVPKVEGGENQADPKDIDYIPYYHQYPYYLGYQSYSTQPMVTNPTVVSSQSVTPRLGMVGQLKPDDSGPLEPSVVRRKALGEAEGDKYSNSTIENDSIEDIGEQDDTSPPPNRSDPIYTAISGLKWKSKSKKWVVRWDNPITNRRVYKYFSGTRYGFMGAHKRAKYYLEFLNASVGKIAKTTPGNPFCRRTEGPPKGKTNKSLIRKFYGGADFKQGYYYHPMGGPNPGVEINYAPPEGSDGQIDRAGSSLENPWCVTQTQVFPGF